MHEPLSRLSAECLSLRETIRQSHEVLELNKKRVTEYCESNGAVVAQTVEVIAESIALIRRLDGAAKHAAPGGH